MWSGREGAE
jgi:hypothetical protein